MTKTVDIAFAGAGTIAVAHGMAVEALPDARIVAVASRSPERANELAKRVGAKVCTYDDLPAGAALVVVATPPAQHASQTLHALERGAAVLVEKPLCTTMAEADAMVDADPDGTRITYAENLLFAPIVGEAMRSVPLLGPLQHLEARSLQTRPTWGAFLTEDWGGGVLFDLGVHPLALVLRAVGMQEHPVAVRASLEGADDVPVDLWAEVHLEFDSGLTARVEASWRDAEPMWDLQAASADGVVRLELLPNLELECNGEPVPHPQPPAATEVPQIQQYGYTDQLAAALLPGPSSVSDVRLGHAVMDIVCAAYSSAGRGGERVPLPFDGARDRTPLQLWRGG